MKKILLFILLFGSFCLEPLPAKVQAEKDKDPEWILSAFSPSWTPVQLSFFPLYLFHYGKTKVYGVNISVTGAAQITVYGVSCGPLIASVDHCGIAIAGLFGLYGELSGIAVAPVNMVLKNNGVALGIFNIGNPDISMTVGSGVQIGLINEAASGLQIGLLNHNPNALIPWMPLVNWSAYKTPAGKASPK